MAIGVDRISKLHDDLLLHILSFLPYTNDRARTSTLSKRWRHLWTYHPTIRIAITPSNVSSDSHARQLRAIDGCLGRPNVAAALRTLDVSVRSSPRIASLEEARSAAAIADRWIRLAALRSVRVLRLSLDSALRDRTVGNLVDPVFSCCRAIAELKLLGPWNIGGLPPNFRGFSFLRELGLHGCSIADGVLESLMSRCPVLERLAYTSSYDSTPSELVVSSKTLRHAAVRAYASPAVRLKVAAPSLLSIRLSGRVGSLFFEDTPSLCHVDVRGLVVVDGEADALPMQPDGGWSSVEKLQADHGLFREYLLQRSPSFTNLKELRYVNKWTTDLRHHPLMSMLGNCPTLENLQVDLDGAKRWIAVRSIIDKSKGNREMLSKLAEEYCKGGPAEEEEEEYANFRWYSSPHRLKNVRIKGILGTRNEMRLVDYLLEKGEAMQPSTGIGILRQRERGAAYRMRFFQLYPFELVLSSAQ